MSINKSYAVFGLGRYGLAVAKELVASGVDVLAVDADEAVINSAAAEIPVCKCADVSDPEVIKALGISNMDVVVISMAEHLEESVMAVMLCKEAGVPEVVAKCASDTHGKILSKVGADKVVLPERESGVRLAKNLLSDGFVDVIELSGNVSLVELDVKPEWVGKSLIELNLRQKYAINIVAIRQNGEIQINIDPNEKLTADMQLVVISNSAALGKLRK